MPEKQEVHDFEDLDYLAQEAIIDLVVSIIKNTNKDKKEE